MQNQALHGPPARCYWCNKTVPARERIAIALAVARRHLPDVEGADLDAMGYLVSEAEGLAQTLMAHSHAGSSDDA
jgi:hypothetical protein